jgi:alpha-beta hydrolase superfamily lysophospholipase
VRADSLVNYNTTARWGTEVLDTIDRIKTRVCEIRLPILILHGQADRLNSADGAQQYFETLTCLDKNLHIYPGSFHELHNDLNHAQVLEDLVEWLLQHRTAPAEKQA